MDKKLGRFKVIVQIAVGEQVNSIITWLLIVQKSWNFRSLIVMLSFVSCEISQRYAKIILRPREIKAFKLARAAFGIVVSMALRLPHSRTITFWSLQRRSAFTTNRFRIIDHISGNRLISDNWPISDSWLISANCHYIKFIPCYVFPSVLLRITSCFLEEIYPLSCTIPLKVDF